MNKHQIEGTLRETAGRVEEAFGTLSDDAKLQLRGKARRIVGEVEASAGDTLDSVRDLAIRRPVGTVLLAAGAAFLLGMLWTKSQRS